MGARFAQFNDAFDIYSTMTGEPRWSIMLYAYMYAGGLADPDAPAGRYPDADDMFRYVHTLLASQAFDEAFLVTGLARRIESEFIRQSRDDATCMADRNALLGFGSAIGADPDLLAKMFPIDEVAFDRRRRSQERLTAWRAAAAPLLGLKRALAHTPVIQFGASRREPQFASA